MKLLLSRRQKQDVVVSRSHWGKQRSAMVRRTPPLVLPYTCGCDYFWRETCDSWEPQATRSQTPARLTNIFPSLIHTMVCRDQWHDVWNQYTWEWKLNTKRTSIGMNIDIESGEGRFETAVRHPVEGRVQRGLASLSCYSRFLCTSQSWWLDNCHTQWVGQHDWKQQQQQPRKAIRWRCCSSWDRKKVRSFKSKVSCPDVCSNGSGFLEVLRSRHDATLTPHRRQLITLSGEQQVWVRSDEEADALEGDLLLRCFPSCVAESVASREVWEEILFEPQPTPPPLFLCCVSCVVFEDSSFRSPLLEKLNFSRDDDPTRKMEPLVPLPLTSDWWICSQKRNQKILKK